MAITVIRTIIIYIFIIVALRVTGKRQIGELQPIELVVTLLISDLAVIPMQENGVPLISGLIPIAVLVALELILSTLMMKSNGISMLISGHPVTIIQNGKVLQKELRRLRIGLDDLTETLRQQGIFDIRDVQYAVVETDGKVSVYQKTKTGKQVAAVPVINDGQPVEWGLKFCGLSRQWLTDTLKKKKLDIREVLLMTSDSNGSVCVIKKETGK